MYGSTTSTVSITVPATSAWFIVRETTTGTAFEGGTSTYIPGYDNHLPPRDRRFEGAVEEFIRLARLSSWPAQAVPRGRLPAPFDLRADTARRLDSPPTMPHGTLWMPKRQGGPRERKPPRTRRRQRVWERDTE